MQGGGGGGVSLKRAKEAVSDPQLWRKKKINQLDSETVKVSAENSFPYLWEHHHTQTLLAKLPPTPSLLHTGAAPGPSLRPLKDSLSSVDMTRCFTCHWFPQSDTNTHLPTKTHSHKYTHVKNKQTTTHTNTCNYAQTHTQTHVHTNTHMCTTHIRRNAHTKNMHKQKHTILYTTSQKYRRTRVQAIICCEAEIAPTHTLAAHLFCVGLMSHYRTIPGLTGCLSHTQNVHDDVRGWGCPDFFEYLPIPSPIPYFCNTLGKKNTVNVKKADPGFPLFLFYLHSLFRAILWSSLSKQVKNCATSNY